MAFQECKTRSGRVKWYTQCTHTHAHIMRKINSVTTAAMKRSNNNNNIIINQPRQYTYINIYASQTYCSVYFMCASKICAKDCMRMKMKYFLVTLPCNRIDAPGTNGEYACRIHFTIIFVCHFSFFFYIYTHTHI